VFLRLRSYRSFAWLDACRAGSESELNREAGPEGRNNLAQRFSAGWQPKGMSKSRRDDTMSHSYSNNRVHVIFSTKERKKCLSDDFQPKLWAYMAGIAHNQGFEALIIDGVRDHVHARLVLPQLCRWRKPSSSSKAAHPNGLMKPRESFHGRRAMVHSV
jgi:hypothetical protein